jgi:hypothetical protein
MILLCLEWVFILLRQSIEKSFYLHHMNIEKQIFDSFEIDESFLPKAINDEGRFAEMRKILLQRIEELLEKDVEKLMWILYRIDVNEGKVRKMLEENSSLNYAEVLTDLIIERQIEKAKSRQQYSTGDSDWSFEV